MGVLVYNAGSGQLRRAFNPFIGQVQASLRDLNGDGIADLVLQITRSGRKRLLAFNAIDLSPLPAPRTR
jgi:hypothetical protein